MESPGRRGVPGSGGSASVSQELRGPALSPCTQHLAGPAAPLVGVGTFYYTKWDH